MTSKSYGVSFFVLFHFRLSALIEAAALRSIVFRYAGTPIATRVSFFFLFVCLEMSPFPSICCTIAILSLYIWRVRRTFSLPGGVLLPWDHGLDFLHQLIM